MNAGINVKMYRFTFTKISENAIKYVKNHVNIIKWNFNPLIFWFSSNLFNITISSVRSIIDTIELVFPSVNIVKIKSIVKNILSIKL